MYTLQQTGFKAKGSEMDKIYGLDLGSDDYLVKPFRVDKSHSRETGGTGLGLSIVKHAAKIQNAKLTLESQENHGTSVSVVF